MFDSYDEYLRHRGPEIDDDYDEPDIGDLADVAYQQLKEENIY